VASQLSHVVIVASPTFDLANSLRAALAELGISALYARTAASALRIARALPQVALVEVGGSFPIGLQTIRRLSAISVPVVALADPEDTEHVVRAMEHGAFDYLTAMPEPESLQHLLLSADQVRVAEPRKPENESVATIRDLVVDVERCQARLKGTALALTPSEFSLLATLAKHAGRVLSSQALFFAMRGQQLAEQEARELVKVHLRRVRAKLEPLTEGDPYIVAVRGFGYMIERREASRSSHRKLARSPSDFTGQPDDPEDSRADAAQG
jgi:DNA-binding response OmpR family regulator